MEPELPEGKALETIAPSNGRGPHKYAIYSGNNSAVIKEQLARRGNWTEVSFNIS